MRALSHSGRPCAPGTPLACCLKGRYSVAVPSGGGGTGLSSQRWRTSKVFVPPSSTLMLICLRATALLSIHTLRLMVAHAGDTVPYLLSQVGCRRVRGAVSCGAGDEFVITEAVSRHASERGRVRRGPFLMPAA